MDPLASFSPAARTWFRETFGQPTPPQAEGWPAIQRGEHALILAPTGSGKTLAAFLWGLDELYRARSAAGAAPDAKARPDGIGLLYVSPLKALNNDIERNLRFPLEGLRAAAARRGQPWPELRVAVRTGDTPASARAQMLRRPPDILITTPESLYLMLTSPRARTLFRTVRGVIVDEIHTLCGNKRGAHLALSLERLTRLAEGPVQRIGLSATVRPLEEAARFLGGQAHGPAGLAPRPVTIVDAHYRKALKLEVVTAVDDFRDLPGDSVWPAVIPQVLDDIRRHRTTLIFANNRRLAERTADRLNAQLAAEQSEAIPPGSPEALAPGGQMRDRGIFAIGAEGPIRAHHGSMSKEARRQMEEDLKAGRLPALVGTSSLELGIDIGAVDLVVQLQSPKSVAQGLQRVGRSGHLVGQTSHGRIYATFREDLMEAAAITRGMLDGDVEPTYTPENPLDVLAQQIVAMVAMEPWPVRDLFDLVRQAYPYRNLAPDQFQAVLEMLAGKYYLDAPQVRAVAALRPKLAWDRVNDRLAALPGTRMLAMSNVGTIPDTGAYGVYLSDGQTRVGELDEEFVFETRVGDAFLLGSSVWRVTEIRDDRLLVTEAAGATPRMPFWNGDYPYRPYELGVRIGQFRREIAGRLAGAADTDAAEQWLRREYRLDERSARNLVEHVRRQLDAVGVLSSDRTIVAETFQDAVGDTCLVVHSPFGGRVNGAWALALQARLRERTGVTPEAQTNDDGLIFRFPGSDREPPVDIVRTLTPDEARRLILRELPDLAVFGAQFRMNAARALLLPRQRGQKRTPFWLQRLKARDLLALARRFDDFPIVAETTRDCLRDVFDLPHLEEILARIQSGEIAVAAIQTATPSPVAASLLYNFVSVFMYEWDAPKAERQLRALALPPAADLGGDAGDWSRRLRPEAVAEVVQRAGHLAAGHQARTVEELALLLRELGDLTTAEVVARCAGDGAAWLGELAGAGRAVEITLGGEKRWVAAELAGIYQAAGQAPGPEAADVLRRFLRAAGPVTRAAIQARYPFPAAWLDETLAQWVAARELARGRFSVAVGDEYCDARLLEQMQRRTLARLRQEVQPVSLAAYAAFLARWQHVHPAQRLHGPDGLRRILEQLRGLALPISIWEREVLPGRLARYDPADLDALGQAGELVWAGAPAMTTSTDEGTRSGRDPRRLRVRLFFRGEGALFLEPPAVEGLSAPAQAVYDFLKSEGASFTADLEAGLALNPAELGHALSELIAAGLITNDSFETLRQAAAAGPEADRERRPLSPLEEELAARLGARLLTPGRYRQARQQVSRRLRSTAPTASASAGGRWALLQRARVLGPALSDEGRAEGLARVLLARHGIVTRDCLEREAGDWDWARLYQVLQRLEMRGEVRRGYFVAGLPGAQFALPEAVEKLREPPDDAVVVLSAMDPACVLGGAAGAGLSLARVPSTHVALVRGQLAAAFEDNGRRVAIASGTGPDVVERAVRAYLARPHAPGRIVVTEWDGARVSRSAGEAVLKALGFQTTPSGMEWYRPAP